MDLFDAIKKRASVRAFVPCEITAAELERIVDAGRRAPSGMNRQPWEFIVVRDKAVIERLGKVQDCIAQACAAVAVVMDEKASVFWKEDAAAAIENMLLSVTALGYASLWVEGYVLKHEQYARETLGVPADKRLLAILPIGKPASEPRQAAKKALADVTYLDHYGQPWKR